MKRIPAQIGRHVLDDDDGKLLFLNVFLYEVGSVSNEVFLYVFYYAAIQHTWHLVGKTIETKMIILLCQISSNLFLESFERKYHSFIRYPQHRVETK